MALKKSQRADYWREVRRIAWESSKQYFAWAYPTGTFVLSYAVLIKMRGWAEVREDLVTSLVVAGASAFVAICAYAISIKLAIEKVHDVNLHKITSLSGDRRKLLLRLSELHDAGTAIRDDIRKRGPWKDAYKHRYQHWAREAEDLLRAEATTQLGRFRSDIARSQQVFQPGANFKQAD